MHRFYLVWLSKRTYPMYHWEESNSTQPSALLLTLIRTRLCNRIYAWHHKIVASHQLRNISVSRKYKNRILSTTIMNLTQEPIEMVP